MHLSHTLQDLSKLVAAYTNVVEQHSIDDTMVKKLASFSYAHYVALIEQIILKAKCLSANLVKNWQYTIEILYAPFHQLNARIALSLSLNKGLFLKIVLDMALLKTFIVVKLSLDL